MEALPYLSPELLEDPEVGGGVCCSQMAVSCCFVGPFWESL